MEYLHKHKEEFINAVNLASEYFHIFPVIVEKDYYVTMILRELTERTIEGFIECDLREKSLMTMRKKPKNQGVPADLRNALVSFLG